VKIDGMLYIKIEARFVAHSHSSILPCQTSAQSVSVVAERIRFPSVILQLIRRKIIIKLYSPLQNP